MSTNIDSQTIGVREHASHGPMHQFEVHTFHGFAFLVKQHTPFAIAV